MKNDIRRKVESFKDSLEWMEGSQPDTVKAFTDLLNRAYKPGAIDLKTKELISIAVLAYNRCDDCIVYHVYKALEAGATKEEIIEATMIAVVLGGGPSMLYSGQIIMEAVEELAPEFE